MRPFEINGMGLSHHQINVLAYFQQSLSRFLDFIMSNKSQDVFDGSDIYREIVIFLDSEIRREMKSYGSGTRGYERLIDMLIEVHVMKPCEELSRHLLCEFDSLFRYGLND